VARCPQVSERALCSGAVLGHGVTELIVEDFLLQRVSKMFGNNCAPRFPVVVFHTSVTRPIFRVALFAVQQEFSTFFLPFTPCQLPNTKFTPCFLFTHSRCRKIHNSIIKFNPRIGKIYPWLRIPALQGIRASMTE